VYRKSVSVAVPERAALCSMYILNEDTADTVVGYM
jgi:hypothetical protein